MLGRVSGVSPTGGLAEGHLTLEELARFPNEPVRVGGRLHWDILALYRSIVEGLRAAPRLDGIGIDSWGVDYGLLDADGVLLSNPVHYRDARTDGVPERVFAEVSAAELYRRTGIQVLPFNTVFQLAASRGTAALANARTMLLIPDLLTYWLTGDIGAELTNASTTALLDPRTGAWDTDLMAALGLDAGLLPPLREPGTLAGPLHPDVAEEIGQSNQVIRVASHDTASAVAAVPASHDRFAYISCGTWSLVGVELTEPVVTEESRAANFTNERGIDGTIRYLRNVMGLWPLQECLRTWRAQGLGADLAELLAAAATREANTTIIDIDDPAFLPPGDMPERIVEACRRAGQTVPTDRVGIVRCIVDSLAVAHRRAVEDAVRLSGRPVEVVHLIGGGSHNELLCQATADACGLPVVAGPAEATAIGNVLVQVRALLLARAQSGAGPADGAGGSGAAAPRP
ncbi:MAG: rhamnulokinase, partial [Micromonosporaceae bacterium]|nr:rhamnulokinase [Micromonosporaceae bacterium]